MKDNQTYFFYDLETSGLNSKLDRIMQFAGIRTDKDFNQIGEPINELIRLNDDVLPSPKASMVTGITPQQTVADGYTEAEFAKKLHDEIFTPNTVVVGFNNIRFDDEFIRHFFWRNFYDPYEWSYANGRSRWDMLDVVRMVRALRPEGIEWPEVDGRAVNKLELLTRVNGIDHYKAHDALSDVYALIEITKLIAQKQPKMFEYLLKMRSKNEISNLVNPLNPTPFVYTSGRYEEKFQKTTIALPLAETRFGAIAVYDLRYDPEQFLNMSVDELAKKIFASWEDRQKDDFVRLPAKELQLNRCPAVAPLGVLEQGDSWQRLQLDKSSIEANYRKILSSPGFVKNLQMAFNSRPEFTKSKYPEAQLYDGFLSDGDKKSVESVRNASERELTDFHPNFIDKRLSDLLENYKARNYPKSMSEEEFTGWDKRRGEYLKEQLPKFMSELQEAYKTADDSQQFILQELQLWAESIIPAND